MTNYCRLAKLGSLTIAGPCADPDKVTRGIVVIHADSIPDAEAMFGPDYSTPSPTTLPKGWRS